MIALIVGFVLYLTLSDRPVAGLGPLFVVGTAALALLALWSLVSSAWSGSPARALLEYDRALLYLLAFVLLGSAGRTDGRLRLAARGLAIAAFALCACALITRLLPEVWSLPPELAEERLSFPLTYWNALGLLAAIGMVICFSLSADTHESSIGRMLAAAALPVMATTLLLTFARGPLAAGAVGLVVAALAVRSRALLAALLAGVPAVAISVRAAYGADLVAAGALREAAAIAQGREVALVVLACTLGALALRALGLMLDRRLTGVVRVPSRRVLVAGSTVAVLALAAGALALGAPQMIERQFERFATQDQVETTDLRERLTTPANNGRLEHWRTALAGFDRAPVRGTGAGTYALLWDQERQSEFQVEDAHSLYLEMLAELGVIGLMLVVVVVGIVLVGLLLRARGPSRAVAAGLLGAALTWALHAGIDWDWEMPAVTAWFFGAGGLALASGSRPGAPDGRRLPKLQRVGLALGCLLLAVVPARIAFSEARLDDGRQAFARGDCAGAVDSALGSIDALAVRADSYVILGYCDVRLGLPDLAVRAMDGAVARDPGNWETHYGRALVLGAAGRDPRPAARRALALNPLAPLAREAVDGFATDDPQTWRRRALEARLPVE
ncbi:MAG: O-antigen ligase family protein [Chloroflexi bacterium]|nr:O-antigen ligase family protein [Chloroflexota bacterium]